VIALDGAQTLESPQTGQDFIPSDEYRFRVQHVGSYWIRAGREIVVTPTPDAGMREVRLFLLGTAWAALCYQRGLLPLHASAVQVGDHAVAFCGATGTGKSTLAAWLSERGYSLISDDRCRFDISPQGQALVYPSARRSKLWRDALEMFG
jgi:hypothetical protein